MGRKSEDSRRRRRKDKARDKMQRMGKNTLRGARFKLHVLKKVKRAKTGKKMNKNGEYKVVSLRPRMNKKENKLICKFGI